MKFSTVLGTFAISTLEAYHAYASPLEPVSLRARSLQARNTEYCCVVTKPGVPGTFVPWNGHSAPAAASDDCSIIMMQTSTPPSKGGCRQWWPVEGGNCLDFSISMGNADQCRR
ncbi:hypothetical protein E4U12_002767 [Claviceps purpurea]|nr:hypothetical protein E4U12_002767 [Claviceps purpurea]KAG6144642.1 hypothetical protein E4U28_001910 [Claviceps purpurea]